MFKVQLVDICNNVLAPKRVYAVHLALGVVMVPCKTLGKILSSQDWTCMEHNCFSHLLFIRLAASETSAATDDYFD